MSVFALSMSYSTPAYASLTEDIAAASNGYLKISPDGGVYAHVPGGVDVRILEAAVTTATRVCDGPEAIVSDHVYWDGINASGIAELESRKAFVDDWIASNIRSIVRAGTGRDSAIHTVFNYIADNYAYDYSCQGNKSAMCDSQGAYYAIVNGKGVCASLCKLFRGLVEALPFNADGVVDYSMDPASASRIRVALINNLEGTHEWAAIQDNDGIWCHYDLAMSIESCEVRRASLDSTGEVVIEY